MWPQFVRTWLRHSLQFTIICETAQPASWLIGNGLPPSLPRFQSGRLIQPHCQSCLHLQFLPASAIPTCICNSYLHLQAVPASAIGTCICKLYLHLQCLPTSPPSAIPACVSMQHHLRHRPCNLQAPASLAPIPPARAICFGSLSSHVMCFGPSLLLRRLIRAMVTVIHLEIRQRCGSLTLTAGPLSSDVM